MEKKTKQLAYKQYKKGRSDNLDPIDQWQGGGVEEITSEGDDGNLSEEDDGGNHHEGTAMAQAMKSAVARVGGACIEHVPEL